MSQPILDLNTCIANAAEIFYERRLLCERRAEEAITTAATTSYGQTAFGTEEFLHNAKVASDEARRWAMFEAAARDGHLLRMQSGTVGDLVTCDPVLAPVYAAAQKAGRVRTLKSDEAEDLYLNGTVYQDPETIG
jgi:hypothetical protein